MSRSNLKFHNDKEVKSQMLEGEKTVSLAADLKATFSISLHKDAGSSEPITSSNLKLGEVYFSLSWSWCCWSV